MVGQTVKGVEHKLAPDGEVLVRGDVVMREYFKRPDATADDMNRACRSAGALDFVNAMPHGLDSRIGRGGGTLSNWVPVGASSPKNSHDVRAGK